MKKIYLIVVVILSVFLMPSLTYACEMKSEKSCCNKETASATNEKMDCCKTNNHSEDNDKNPDSGTCNGKCGHSNCTSSSTHFSLVFFEFNFKKSCFYFSEKKQNYFNLETNLSSGFYSLWLIPKIS